MIDSNNINVMREKLRKVSGGSGVKEEIERIDNLIGSSPIPGSQRTITSSLNYLYDNIGRTIDLLLDNTTTKQATGDFTLSNSLLEYDEILVTHCYAFSTHANLPSEGRVSKVVYEDLIGRTDGTVGVILTGQNNLWIQFKDNTTIRVASSPNESNLLKIYGIKY